MSRAGASGLVFLVAGLAFIAIGSSGQRAFLFIGAAFLVLGLVSLVRQRRAGGPK